MMNFIIKSPKPIKNSLSPFFIGISWPSQANPKFRVKEVRIALSPKLGALLNKVTVGLKYTLTDESIVYDELYSTLYNLSYTQLEELLSKTCKRLPWGYMSDYQRFKVIGLLLSSPNYDVKAVIPTERYLYIEDLEIKKIRVQKNAYAIDTLSFQFIPHPSRWFGYEFKKKKNFKNELLIISVPVCFFYFEQICYFLF